MRPVERLFVDTSAWFAFANRKDRDHVAVVRALNAFEGRLVTSNFVFDETVSLCRYRLGHGAADALAVAILDPETVDLIRVSAQDEHDAWRLFQIRVDQRYSFTDCTSFVLMRRLGIGRALALSGDFHNEGFEMDP